MFPRRFAAPLWIVARTLDGAGRRQGDGMTVFFALGEVEQNDDSARVKFYMKRGER